MLLRSSSFFSSPALPVRLYRTFESHALDWHDHEFVEIAILFEGEATYENDFTSEHVIAGDVMVIPPGGKHRYYNEQNVVLMNLLFKHEQLPFPDNSIRHHPGFIALFG
ncbi:MAG: AraC family ligand binding domain-containing protein, partial [Victivallales bacterium]|nr:AraC family ligand binding domain-containing protein [Victivallales bacterium]